MNIFYFKNVVLKITLQKNKIILSSEFFFKRKQIWLLIKPTHLFYENRKNLVEYLKMPLFMLCQ